MTSPLLYGIHDREGRHILPPGGWCVDTIGLADNAPPTDYTALRDDIQWLVRVNWGYGTTGTIPLPKDDNLYMDRLAHYVHNSRGVHAWIIGNEPNHEQERPDNVYITPERYAEFFAKARTLIKTIASQARVIPAPCAPYHANPTNWQKYLFEMLRRIETNGGCDGIAVHTYTRSSNPDDIDSGAQMGPPLQNQYSGFLSYLDALDTVPSSMLHLPVYITEFNELLPEGWDNRNTGVVQAAYADINDTNQSGTDNLPIMCLCLYRWPNYDKWHIEGKQGVIDDFNAAVGRGYTSPVNGTNAVNDKVQTNLPFTPNESPSAAPDLPPREWDERLTARGVTVETPPINPGRKFWRAVKARWYDEQEAEGRHHIYVEAPSVAMFKVAWPSGETSEGANGKSGFDAANFPMSPSLNEFSVSMDMGLPSEIVKGIGMGANGNPGIHTSTGVTFQLVKMPEQQQTPPPTVIAPGPQPPEPSGDDWPRIYAFLKRWEGGWADHPHDPGGATNKGITFGTFKRWRESRGMGTPTLQDLREIEDAEVEQIFFEEYYKKSGADKLLWPMNLAQTDTAVNAGVDTAQNMLAKSRGNFMAYMGHLIKWYASIKNFEHFGRGWINRRGDILLEASKA